MYTAIINQVVIPLALQGQTNNVAYFWGSIAGMVVITIVLICIADITDALVKARFLRKNKRTTVEQLTVQNELDFAEYIIWAGQNGHTTLFIKEIIEHTPAN